MADDVDHHILVPMYNLSLLELSLPTARRISRVGYIVSLSTLIVSFCIVVAIRALRSQRNKLHLHLFVSFIIRALMFLAEDSGLLEGALDVGVRFINGDIQLVEITDDNAKSSPACKTFVSIWLYAIMANYSWILVQGLYLHNLIFLALTAAPPSIMRYIVLGWGFPVPFLMCWIVLSSTSRNMLCWTESQNPAYFWIIRGPITASIITNFVLFLNITRVVYVKTFAPQSPRHCRYRKLFRSTLILLPLFGVHYTITTVISTILQKNEEDELSWLQLDQVFSSFQGCVVAFLCCFLNSEVQSALWSTWVKWKTTYGSLFTTSRKRCRKHSRAQLKPPDAESNTMGGLAITSSSDNCRFCAQESNGDVVCNSQETVVSFLDLVVRETEEGDINQCYAHENTSSGESKSQETVIEMTTRISSDLEDIIRDENQTSASANGFLFSLTPRNDEGGSNLDLPSYCRIIAEESSSEPGENTSKENDIPPHNTCPTDSFRCCKSTLPEMIVATPRNRRINVIAQQEIQNNLKCTSSHKLPYDSDDTDPSASSPKILMKASKLHGSRNFTDLPKFCCVVTDLTVLEEQTTQETAFNDAVLTPDGYEDHAESKFAERVEMSMSFLKPKGSEDEPCFNDPNESKLPLCSEQSKFRRRSRSEGARWFSSIKKSKVSVQPPERIELEENHSVIIDRTSETAFVPSPEGAQENMSHGNLRQDHGQQQECGAPKSGNPQTEGGKVCLEHYNQLKAIGKIQDLKQNFRPRSSSDCCNKRPNYRRHRSREASPRIPAEWMGDNATQHKRDAAVPSRYKVEKSPQQDRNELFIPAGANLSTNSQEFDIQNSEIQTHRTEIISYQESIIDKNIQN